MLAPVPARNIGRRDSGPDKSLAAEWVPVNLPKEPAKHTCTGSTAGGPQPTTNGQHRPEKLGVG